MIATLIIWAVLFTQLSLLAFGGGKTILPEMQREVVEIQHWMSAETFSSLFGLAQAAPGPNLKMVTLVGWHAAGWWRVLVTTLAKIRSVVAGDQRVALYVGMVQGPALAVHGASGFAAHHGGVVFGQRADHHARWCIRGCWRRWRRARRCRSRHVSTRSGCCWATAWWA